MRFLHAADLHAGVVTWSWPDPKTGLPSRLVDFANVWQWICERAIEHDVDAVLVAGDIFHTANPRAAAIAKFADPLTLLHAAGIPVLLLTGNHERSPHVGEPCVLDAFNRPGAVPVTTPGVYDLGDIRVACLPSVSRHLLMAQGQRWVKGADEDLVDALRRIVADFARSEADILTGHWPVAGSVLGGETDIAITEEPMLQPADLEGPWSYIGFGHIHRAQTFTTPDGTIGAYSGSIDRWNFGEETYDPVVNLVDIDEGIAMVTPIPTPARRFVTIDLPAAVEAGWEPVLLVDVEGAIVRVRGVPESRAHEVRQVVGAGGAALVRLEIARDQMTPVRAAAAAEAPGPLEALDVYLEHRGIDEERRPSIRERARDLVETTS